MRAILTYHSIDPSGSPISVDADAFRRNVEWLASGKVPVRKVSELLSSPPDADGVALTFDDAFVSFRDVAWPLLREHGLPVTVFVPTDHAGGTNAWPDVEPGGVPVLPLLDWDALAELAGEGVSLGSHTKSHRDLRSLDDADLRDELVGAADRIEEVTGTRPEVLAYPYGHADERVAEAAGRVYPYAVTDEFRPVPAAGSPHLVPRLDAYYFQSPGVLERWGSWRFDAYLGVRLLGRRVRRVLEAAGVLR